MPSSSPPPPKLEEAGPSPKPKRRQKRQRRRTNEQKRHSLIVADRRRSVAKLRLEGRTLAEIHEELERLNKLNPKTEKAWGRNTIALDLEYLEKTWTEHAARDVGQHQAEMLAEVRKWKQELWDRGDISLLPKAWERESKLLGLDAPSKHQHDVHKTTQAAVLVFPANGFEAELGALRGAPGASEPAPKALPARDESVVDAEVLEEVSEEVSEEVEVDG